MLNQRNIQVLWLLILVADLSKVYCPPHKRKQQVPENSDIIQKSSQTLEQQHQYTLQAAAGRLRRRRLGPVKCICSHRRK
jgi:hypothetical protein